jgi:DNA polymerase III sliding clamp (beta) subunit (PCNA family)
MQTRREELLSVLAAVKPGLARKEIVEQTTHFIFTGQTISTYNDQVAVSYPFVTKFTCSIKAEDFFKLVQRMRGDLVSLQVKGKKLQVSSPTQTFDLPSEVSDEHQITDLVESLSSQWGAVEWKPVPKDFIDCLNLTLFSTSQDATAGALTCVKIGGNDVFASDRNRLSWAEMEGEMSSVMLMAKDAQELVKYNVKEYQVGESWAHFKTEEGAVFSTRLPIFSPDEYPNVKEMIEDSYAEPVTTRFRIPDTLKSALQFVIVMARTSEERYNIFVRFSLDKDGLVCTADRSVGKPGTKGKATETIEIDYSGEPVTFWVNPNFLLDVLDKTTKFVVRGGRAFFDRDKFVHMIALPTED